jgi:hypothetical protein
MGPASKGIYLQDMHFQVYCSVILSKKQQVGYLKFGWYVTISSADFI